MALVTTNLGNTTMPDIRNRFHPSTAHLFLLHPPKKSETICCKLEQVASSFVIYDTHPNRPQPITLESRILQINPMALIPYQRDNDHITTWAAYYMKKTTQNTHIFCDAAFKCILGVLAFTTSEGTYHSITQLYSPSPLVPLTTLHLCTQTTTKL